MERIDKEKLDFLYIWKKSGRIDEEEGNVCF